MTSNKTKTARSALKNSCHMSLKRDKSTLQGSIWIVSATKKIQTIILGFINRFYTAMLVNNSTSQQEASFVPTDVINCIMLYYWDGKPQIIKVANKSLHKKSMAFHNGNYYNTKENIVQEASILQYLTNNKPPNSLIQYKGYFCGKYNCFLVMEHGGECLFKFITRCHKSIKNNVIDITEWHTFCRNAMKQMVNVLAWLHTRMCCVHLDISLENFTIKNITKTIIMVNNEKKIKFCSDFEIKIIDFGLAEVFSTKQDSGPIDFRCNKYVGKRRYKAPKVYGKTEIFNAGCADCFSLGVCYFMMFFGSSPWERPSVKDTLFRYITNGQLTDVLYIWGLSHYATEEIIDLVLGLLNFSEKHRLTMIDVQKHAWFRIHEK